MKTYVVTRPDLGKTVLIRGHKIGLWRNIENYSLIFPVNPSYLELWFVCEILMRMEKKVMNNYLKCEKILTSVLIIS